MRVEILSIAKHGVGVAILPGGGAGPSINARKPQIYAVGTQRIYKIQRLAWGDSLIISNEIWLFNSKKVLNSLWMILGEFRRHIVKKIWRQRIW